MSTEKTITNTNDNRKKRNRNNVIDSAIVQSLSSQFIQAIEKPTTKFPNAKFICNICSYHIQDADKAVKHSDEAGHKNNLRRTRMCNMMRNLPEPTANQYDAINDCLNDTLTKEIFITEAESIRRKALCAEMNEIACGIGGRLWLCGSLLTDLSMINVSDVNLYFDRSTTTGTSYLSQLEKLSAAFVDKLQMKIEIKQDSTNCGLFCKDTAGFMYHISDTTQLCRHTSQLLLVYTAIDERAHKLMRLFRYFANQAFLDRNNDGLFPAQVLSLLVVFYLQQVTPPVLPNLHRLAETRAELLPDSAVTSVTVDNTVARYVSDPATIRRLWTPPDNRSVTMAHLWLGFLRFLTVQLNSAIYMVSVQAHEPVLKETRNILSKRLAVENPFDTKKNLLFSVNAPEVVDFINDQLNTCYLYFAVPQLVTGPAFTTIKYRDMTAQTMATTRTSLVTPTFTKDDFTVSIELMEADFVQMYASSSAGHDVTKWPVTIFVKTCLATILSSVFDSRQEIVELIARLGVKSTSFFSVANYAQFRDHAINLAECVFRDFAVYLEATGSWTCPEIRSTDALDVIKKATQKFISESLYITMNEEVNDDEEFEMHDMEIDGVEVDEVEVEGLVANGLDGTDTGKPITNDNTKPAKEVDMENWKIPISFNLIYLPQNGIRESSTEAGVYNEHRVQSLEKEEMKYSFSDIPIQRKKLEIVCYFCNVKGHRKESCQDAIPRFDELKNILRKVNSEWIQKLSNVLIKKYETTCPSPESLLKHEKIFVDIEKIIKNLYPLARPQRFGSSHSGFQTRASDIDICIEFRLDGKGQKHLPSKEIRARLTNIGIGLKKSMAGIEIMYILHAKVPIIKFYIGDNIQGDISINNILALQNTKMLKLYSELHNDVKSLGNLIKFMTKSCEIGDASQGTLSSYAYIIMLIHYLQQRGLLPVLQELYEGDTRPTLTIANWDAWYQSDLVIINKLWQRKANSPSLASLWLDFFYYYTVDFNMEREVISIKQSKPLLKIDKGWQMSYMAIEDPFDLNHNLGCHLSLDNFRYILQCFAHVLKIHSNNENLKRKENAHNLLMEPLTLRPAYVDPRSCFKCNKKGHLARDCPDGQYQQTPAKSGATVQPDLSKETLPFFFKQSSIGNHIYVQIDKSESASKVSIPLKAFNGGIDDFSVVPISLNYDGKSIVIPMLINRGNTLSDTLSDMFKSGVQDPRSLCFDAIASNVKTSEASSRNNSANENTQKSVNKNVTIPPENKRIRNENLYYQNFSPNPVRLLATNPGQNPNRFPNFNNQQRLNINPHMYRQYHDQRRYFNGPQTAQQINRQTAYANDYTRYQNSK